MEKCSGSVDTGFALQCKVNVANAHSSDYWVERVQSHIQYVEFDSFCVGADAAPIDAVWIDAARNRYVVNHSVGFSQEISGGRGRDPTSGRIHYI